MVKSVKKVLVGVLAASLMLTSVAFAADSPATAPEKANDNVKTVTKASNKKTVTLGAKVTSVAAGAIQAKTKNLTFSGTKKVTVKKNAFKNAKNLKTITVNKNKVTFEKKAFKGLDTKKMTIKVKGLKKTSAAFKKYVKALKAAGFKGTVKAVK